MSKLRKSLKKTHSILIFPSDEAICREKSAKNLVEDNDYFSIIKELTFPDEELETVKQKFIKNAKKTMIYEYYMYKRFDSSVLVATDDVPLLKYVFEDFNITDLDIIFNSMDGLKSLLGSLKGQSMTQENSLNVITEILSNPTLKDDIMKTLKVILMAKLVKVEGVDSGLTKEEIVEETVKGLQVEDIKALFKFVKASIDLNVEKKNISES